MSDRRLSPRSSVISFVLTAAIATGASLGLFVLLDPRAQAFWSALFTDFVNLVRSFFIR